MSNNFDIKTVNDFGEERARFDQSAVSEELLLSWFELYFGIFPRHLLSPGAVGFGMGCGSGRRAKFAAQRVGRLYCVDASAETPEVVKGNLSGAANVEFALPPVAESPFGDDSVDFAYSLGVLRHVPDTAAGIKSCVQKLKKNAPFLVHLYYAFDNRPPWFRLLWRSSDVFRRGISKLPFGLKRIVTGLIAALIYFPLARTARVLVELGFKVDGFPLSFYRPQSFYTMRTDAPGRFGTRLEQRFTKTQIEEMMQAAGLENIGFSDTVHYWCAVGIKT